MKKIIIPYLVATVFYFILRNHCFDLLSWVSAALRFNLTGAFYFVFFFIQLVIASPFLYAWLNYCNSHKFSYLLHVVTFIVLFVFGAISFKYTLMLNVYGGGKNLLGSTYLLLYYTGMFLASKKIFNLKKGKLKIILFFISLILLLTWGYLYINKLLPFDNYVVNFFGNGINPPSINSSIYALLILFVVYFGISTLEQANNKLLKALLSVFSFIGQGTLYIFLYHMLLKEILGLLNFYPLGSMIKSIIYICILIFVPVILMKIFSKIKMGFNKILQHTFAENE